MDVIFLSDQHKIQFFTWDSAHSEMSWWKHFECEVPELAELGVTQVWLPPPNKATSNVCMPSTCFLGISFILSPEGTGIRCL